MGDGDRRPLGARERLVDSADPRTVATLDGVHQRSDRQYNVTQWRLRDGYTLGYGYDALDRLTSMTTAHLTTDDSDVAYTYDLAGRLTKAAKNAANQTSFTYDALGRRTGESNYYYALTSQYDAAGRRTRLTWNDGFFVTYDYDAAGAMTVIEEFGAGPLATFGYDDAGRRTSLTRGDGSVTSYAYDGASRLASQSLDLAGTAHDLNLTFAYNPASQIASSTRSNDTYAYTAHVNADVAETRDGLNRLTAQGSTPVSYDSRVNVIAVGSQGYVYTTTNRLAIAPQAGVFLYADSLERMDYISAEDVQLAHDGDAIASEHVPTGGAGPVARRYIYGPGADEPVAMYNGEIADDNTRRYLHADERGSIVAVTGTYGALIGKNRYDEYGIPATGNIGRFGYTGQAWLPSLGLYYYKARMYAPRLGRFMQADPIGYAAGMNLSAYVGGDPVNYTDPSGLAEVVVTCTGTLSDGTYRICNPGGSWGGGWQGASADEQPCHPRGLGGALFCPREAEAETPQMMRVAKRYTGDTFCSGATVGNANRFNPFGKIDSGKQGGFGTALNDVGRVAAANGITPLGDVMVNSFTTGVSILAAIPHGLGDGWYVSTNPFSGDTSFSNSGLNFRYNAQKGTIRIDIPSGFNLPNGGQLAQNETCHYRR